MAWSMVNRVDETKKIFLLSGQEHIVGRKGTDINLPDDLSISRKHATIRIDHATTNITYSQRVPTVTIKDCSKYGTVVNGKKLDAIASLLNNGDIIQFGVFDNIWRIIYTPFVCATSGLSKAEKRTVVSNILQLGGHVVSEWTEACTHLIMDKVFMTMKVVNALVSQSHIIMPKYVQDAVTEKSWPSDLKAYEPPIEKSSYYSNDANFQSDEKRRIVFSGKTFFVVSTKQEAKIKFAVVNSGGKILSVDVKLCSEDDVRNEASCIIEPPKEMEKNSYTNLTNLLKKYGKRLISEGEIGLAILLCSTVKYCNPRSNEGALMADSLPDSQFSSDTLHSTYTQTVQMDTTEHGSDESVTMEVDDLIVTSELCNSTTLCKLPHKKSSPDSSAKPLVPKEKPNVDVKIKEEKLWTEELDTYIDVRKKSSKVDVDDKNIMPTPTKCLIPVFDHYQRSFENFTAVRNDEEDNHDKSSLIVIRVKSMVRKRAPELPSQPAIQKCGKVFVKVPPKLNKNRSM